MTDETERDVQTDVKDAETDTVIDESFVEDDVKDTDKSTVAVDTTELDRTRKALEKANREAQDRRLELKEWKELQVDPAKVRQLLDEQRKADVKRKEDEGRYRELLNDVETATQSEIQKIRDEADEKVVKMQGSIEKYFVEKTVAESLAAEGASQKLLGKHVRDQVKVVERDGEYQTVVVDKDGEPRLVRGGGFMTVADLISEMKKDDDFARAFPAPKTSGSGTGDSSNKGSRPNTSGLSKGKMSIPDRAAFRAKHGVEEYNKLPN
jgi:uncharacterized 2Fe-2S/4Fe-4S cluster protein (DUF4445 family)